MAETGGRELECYFEDKILPCSRTGGKGPTWMSDTTCQACDFQTSLQERWGVWQGGPGLQPLGPARPRVRNQSCREPSTLPESSSRGVPFPRLHTQGLPRLSRPDCITCLLIPTGKLEPLVARLMGATTATRVGDGADCLFFGGNAGGGLKQIKKSHETKQPKQNSSNSYQGRASLTIRHFTPTVHTVNSCPTPLLPKQMYQTCQKRQREKASLSLP